MCNHVELHFCGLGIASGEEEITDCLLQSQIIPDRNFFATISKKGTNANKKIPPSNWRVLHVLLRLSLHESILDTHHVRHAITLLKTTYIADNNHL